MILVGKKPKIKIPEFNWKEFGRGRKIPEFNWREFNWKEFGRNGKKKRTKKKKVQLDNKIIKKKIFGRGGKLKKTTSKISVHKPQKITSKISVRKPQKVTSKISVRKPLRDRSGKLLKTIFKIDIPKVSKRKQNIPLKHMTKNKNKKKKKQLTKKEFYMINKKKRKLYYKRLYFRKKQRLTKKLLTKKKTIFFCPRRPLHLEKKTDIFFGTLEKDNKRFKKNNKLKRKRIFVNIKRRPKLRRVKRKLRRLKIRKYFFREKQILLDLILATNLFLGKRQRKKQIQNNLMRNYMLAIRNKHAIYNVNLLVINLRRAFHIISNIYFYKQLIMLNLISQPKILAEHVEAHIMNMSRPTFLVAQTKWVGGALTNYKDIYKRLYSNLNKQEKIKKDMAIINQRLEMKGLNLPRPPQLPSLLFSAGECHWAINEAKKLKLKTVQCVESHHTTYFTDINIAVSVSQFPLIMLVSLLKEACIFGNLSFKKYTRRFLGKRRFFKFAHERIKRSLLKKLK